MKPEFTMEAIVLKGEPYHASKNLKAKVGKCGKRRCSLGPYLEGHLKHPSNKQDGEVLLYGPKTWSPC